MQATQLAVRLSDSDSKSLEAIRKFYGVQSKAEAIRIALKQTAERVPKEDA